MSTHEHEAKESNRLHKQPNGREDSKSNKKRTIRRKIRKAALPTLRIKQSNQKGKNAQQAVLAKILLQKTAENGLMTSQAQYSAEEK